MERQRSGALGYLFVAVICAIFALGKYPPRVPEPEEAELDRLHGGDSPAPPTPAVTGPAVPVATGEPVGDEKREPAVNS